MGTGFTGPFFVVRIRIELAIGFRQQSGVSKIKSMGMSAEIRRKGNMQTCAEIL